jgi:hypothetical protein
MPLKQLHGAFVLLGGGPAAEGAEVAAFTAGAFLSRVQSKLSVAEFTNHDEPLAPVWSAQIGCGIVPSPRQGISAGPARTHGTKKQKTIAKESPL